MRNKILKLFMVFATSFVYAGTADLEQMMQDLHNKNVNVVIPPLPDYKLPMVNFKPVNFRNIFSQNRLQDDAESYSSLQNYSLNQLQMVGYMKQKNTDYAFIKTPYETLMVKVGNKIKQGSVVKIFPEMVEIEELQIQENKQYHKTVYLKLEENKNNNLKLKLQ